MKTRLLSLLLLGLPVFGLCGCAHEDATVTAAPKTGSTDTAAPETPAAGKPKSTLMTAPAPDVNTGYNSGIGSKAK